MLSDFNDQLLERISTNLDDAAGLKKEIDPVLVEITDSRKSDQSTRGTTIFQLIFNSKCTRNPSEITIDYTLGL